MIGVGGGIFWVGGGEWTFFMCRWGVGGSIFWESGGGWRFMGMNGAGHSF